MSMLVLFVRNKTCFSAKCYPYVKIRPWAIWIQSRVWWQAESSGRRSNVQNAFAKSRKFATFSTTRASCADKSKRQRSWATCRVTKNFSRGFSSRNRQSPKTTFSASRTKNARKSDNSGVNSTKRPKTLTQRQTKDRNLRNRARAAFFTPVLSTASWAKLNNNCAIENISNLKSIHLEFASLVLIIKRCIRYVSIANLIYFSITPFLISFAPNWICSYSLISRFKAWHAAIVGRGRCSAANESDEGKTQTDWVDRGGENATYARAGNSRAQTGHAAAERRRRTPDERKYRIKFVLCLCSVKYL